MVDNEAKKRLGYTDPRSKVRPDGSEILYGKDWSRRKQELWDRAQGRCEQFVPVNFGQVTIREEQCRSEAHDPHHLIKRSKKRDDRLANLRALCRLHHDLLDSRKVKWTKKSHSFPS